MIKSLIKILCGIFILTIGITIGSYFVMHTDIDYDESAINNVNEYIVNTRTKKIHIDDCPAVDRMSNKNRKQVNDNIINLTNKGYVICNKCNAGLKRKNEFLAKSKTLIDNIVFNDNVTLPTREEYLASIDLIGEWYTNNVPTYLTKLQEESINNYILSPFYIKEYILKNKLYKESETIKKYNVCTLDNKYNKISSYSNATLVLMAKQEAVDNYYKSYNNIKHYKSISLYPCEYISDSLGGYNMAGDDCVRFMFTCMNNVNKNFTQILSKYSKKSWHQIGSVHIGKEKREVVFAMHEAGFEVYDTINDIIDINKDGVPEIIINKINGDFKLQKGDILARDGHIHLYMGEGYSMREKNFGWGHVNRDYPQLSPVGLSSLNNGYKIFCKDGNYNRVYRYVGDE